MITTRSVIGKYRVTVCPAATVTVHADRLVLRQPVLQDARDDLGGQAAGLLAEVLASHAVGNEEEVVIGIGHEAVFVVGASALGAAAGLKVLMRKGKRNYAVLTAR